MNNVNRPLTWVFKGGFSSSSLILGTKMDRICLDQSGPGGGPNWTGFGPVLDRGSQFGPRKIQVIVKQRENVDRDFQKFHQFYKIFLSHKIGN